MKTGQFVEIVPAAAPPALEAGRVAARVMFGPSLILAQANRLRVLGNPYLAIAPRLLDAVDRNARLGEGERERGAGVCEERRRPPT